MRTAICLTGEDMQGGVGQVGTTMQNTPHRSSVGIPHLFCPVEEGSNPGGRLRSTGHPENPFMREREREWDAVGGGSERRRERERGQGREGKVERKGERGRETRRARVED